jgi:hypothetical protein
MLDIVAAFGGFVPGSLARVDDGRTGLAGVDDRAILGQRGLGCRYITQKVRLPLVVHAES